MWVMDYVFHISFVISTGFKYVDNELRIPNELKPIPFSLSLWGEKGFFEGNESFILFFFLLLADRQGLPETVWWEAGLPKGEGLHHRGSSVWWLRHMTLGSQKPRVPIPSLLVRLPSSYLKSGGLPLSHVDDNIYATRLL